MRHSGSAARTRAFFFLTACYNVATALRSPCCSVEPCCCLFPLDGGCEGVCLCSEVSSASPGPPPAASPSWETSAGKLGSRLPRASGCFLLASAGRESRRARLTHTLCPGPPFHRATVTRTPFSALERWLFPSILVCPCRTAGNPVKSQPV